MIQTQSSEITQMPCTPRSHGSPPLETLPSHYLRVLDLQVNDLFGSCHFEQKVQALVTEKYSE